MGKLYDHLYELIGHTPLLELHGYAARHQLSARIAGKLEYFNPAGSVKDRVGYAMILDAERRGLLTPDTVIIEPTSGNTGIGLASVAAARGYRMILTMPETMSVERQKLLKAYGAEIVLTEGAKGMQGAIDRAEALAASLPRAFIPAQFSNPANPAAHEASTGPEIWEDTAGQVDILVAGIGTGGTLCGTGRYLKEQNPQIQLVAVEPASSPLITKGKTGPHKIQGIGANFIPDNYDASLVDEVIAVTDGDAIAAAKELGKTEGLLVGISSGAACFAAAKLAARSENEGKLIVAIFPDTGERYLSTALFSE
ncbi:cysteine synthase A [Zongyangia hominis]|uniref:Cysteine synthase n=1 Tax=Zongyangia hominis TaxID=2763677 RepID=A0A926IAY4_9FIRM|nr:cysteine synthase A [Zongyangia hominis]MBC8569703.1 cysteine synthase A [Zongyangia hominis]